jgi:hypothetical protein
LTLQPAVRTFDIEAVYFLNHFSDPVAWSNSSFRLFLAPASKFAFDAEHWHGTILRAKTRNVSGKEGFPEDSFL